MSKASDPSTFAKITAVLIAAWMLAPLTHAQTIVIPFAREPGAVYDPDVPNEKPGPAPRRDLSGIWEPARSLGDDVGADGAKALPADGKPGHEPPFTPESQKAYIDNNTTLSYMQGPPVKTNDPMPGYDPQGVSLD